MSAERETWRDEQIGRILGNLLQTGVIISAAVVFAGGLLYLIQHGGATPDFHTFHGEPDHLRSLSGIIGAAFALDSRGIIQFGLLILIATPVARVAVSFLAFSRHRDYTYALFTLIVLSVLLYSLGLLKI
jgi:uncharacterized membrane protein